MRGTSCWSLSPPSKARRGADPRTGDPPGRRSIGRLVAATANVSCSDGWSALVSDRPRGTLLASADHRNLGPPDSAVDKQAMERTKQRHRTAREAGELKQPMGQRLAAAPARQLLARDRSPHRIDHLGGGGGDL